MYKNGIVLVHVNCKCIYGNNGKGFGEGTIA